MRKKIYFVATVVVAVASTRSELHLPIRQLSARWKLKMLRLSARTNGTLANVPTDVAPKIMDSFVAELQDSLFTIVE